MPASANPAAAITASFNFGIGISCSLIVDRGKVSHGGSIVNQRKVLCLTLQITLIAAGQDFVGRNRRLKRIKILRASDAAQRKAAG